MNKSRFSGTQIVSSLKPGDAGVPVKDLRRQAGISPATYYQRKSRYGGMDASDLKRIKELEAENARLKRMYAGPALDNAAMKDLIAEKPWAGAETRGGALPRRGARTATAPVLRLRRPVAIGPVCPADGLDSARCRGHRRAGPPGRAQPSLGIGKRCQNHKRIGCAAP